jgi:hypothetical protein
VEKIALEDQLVAHKGKGFEGSESALDKKKAMREHRRKKHSAGHDEVKRQLGVVVGDSFTGTII